MRLMPFSEALTPLKGVGRFQHMPGRGCLVGGAQDFQA